MKLAPVSTCTACMACVDSCRQGALSIFNNSDGFFQVLTETNRCVDCGLCKKVCPVINPSPIKKEAVNESHPYAAWCEDSDLRSMSASGGAFAGLAQTFLEHGAVVYGAVLDGFCVSHKRIESVDDLPQLLGSKYQHSSMEGVHSMIKKDLEDGRVVLFSGLSCQVAGLLRFVGKQLSANLFTIDTICGGLSTMLPMMKMKECGNYKGILSYRDKENGWRSKGFKYALKMKRQDESIENLGMDNMMILCFNHKETKRSSCLDCQFNGFHRESDITIGDFWGDSRFMEQHQNGLSVIITHTGRLSKFLQTSSLHIEPVTWQEVVDKNPNLYWSHYPNYRRLITRKLIFQYLRKGNDEKVLLFLEKNTILKRIESRLFLHKYEQEKKDYLFSALGKQ